MLIYEDGSNIKLRFLKIIVRLSNRYQITWNEQWV